MTDASVLEVMLLRWGESPGGRTVTFLLPDDPGDHPFKGLKAGRAHGERLAISIARISDDETVQPEKERKSWHEMPPASQAAIRCGEKAFWKFLESVSNKYCSNFPPEARVSISSQDGAAGCVRIICGVQSRSELSTNETARKKWEALDSEYQAWLRAG